MNAKINLMVMKNPNIKTVIVHSRTKSAWNVVGVELGGKYKIARVPYLLISENESYNERSRVEAFELAEFISYCFNHSGQILEGLNPSQTQNL